MTNSIKDLNALVDNVDGNRILKKNIFEIAKQQANGWDKDDSTKIKGKSVVICGCRNSGKSNLVKSFLESSDNNDLIITNSQWISEENELAHYGIEFDEAVQSFAKSTKTLASVQRRSSSTENLTHSANSLEQQKVSVKLAVYESMGPDQFQTTAPVALINKENITSCLVVIVADLSKPAASFKLVKEILNQLKAHVVDVLARLEERKSDRPRQLWKKLEQRYGSSQEWTDFLRNSIIPVPVLIVGSKIDLCSAYTEKQLELIASSFRYLAHVYGSSFVTDNLSSTKSSALSLQSARQQLNISDAGSQTKKSTTLSSSSHVCIPAGKDSLDQINVHLNDKRNIESSLYQLLDALNF